MKTKLLFLFLCLSALGYSQTYDNSSGYYINELIASISGTDAPDEYIELRGPASTALPAGTYFVTIEGDGNSGNLGKVDEALDLSGLTFGANGYLTITFSGSSYESHFQADSNNYTEVEVIAYDGNLLDYSATYLLINSSTDPDGVIVDTDPDGEFDATGDHTSWIIYDSVSSLDDDDSAEYGYGQMNVTTNYTTTPNIFNIPSGSSVMSCDNTPGGGSTSNVYYIARQGESTGYDANSDWMAGQTNSGSTRPFWEFSGTVEKNVPDALSSYILEASTFGGLNYNPTDDALSTDDFLTSNFRIYPNPAKTIITIESLDNTQIDSIELFSVLGRNVLTTKILINDAVDVSELTSGIYLLKVNSGNNSVTKRVVID
ncbi:putative secreted protein (Por secretion system target) [Winogradskyella eximia]|uniref:Putative secreted protein (Por secretion system target) n=1 Tax=Winogradskyella eximia TaxID=262006 RepID=A0A3D9H3U6_9FLAO|nr:T9SS type A sorting domain-containing protein [Winogradskyella eximia]RED43881.1 putative secreted protein (Por secretion system target) [Winogradskyella eximia]